MAECLVCNQLCCHDGCKVQGFLKCQRCHQAHPNVSEVTKLAPELTRQRERPAQCDFCPQNNLVLCEICGRWLCNECSIRSDGAAQCKVCPGRVLASIPLTDPRQTHPIVQRRHQHLLTAAGRAHVDSMTSRVGRGKLLGGQMLGEGGLISKLASRLSQPAPPLETTPGGASASSPGPPRAGGPPDVLGRQGIGSQRPLSPRRPPQKRVAAEAAEATTAWIAWPWAAWQAQAQGGGATVAWDVASWQGWQAHATWQANVWQATMATAAGQASAAWSSSSPATWSPPEPETAPHH